MCKPKKYVGLGILNLAKIHFGPTDEMAMGLWHEWKDEAKPWISLGNPCTTQDKELFATAIKVTIRDGKRASFWETPWLDGRRPMDIAPLDQNGKNAPSTRH
jgi:hypothetical protein